MCNDAQTTMAHTGRWDGFGSGGKGLRVTFL